MAYEARLSDVARGGVLMANIREGMPVSLVNGAGSRNELPGIAAATALATKNVFILLTPPDDFPRPTLAGMYTAPRTAIINQVSETGYHTPVYSDTYYNVGKSVLEDPTLTTGELGIAKRGGTYAVPAGVFVDSSGIKVPGALIKVAAGSLKWDVTTNEAEACGYTEEYRTSDGYLVFTLYQ